MALIMSNSLVGCSRILHIFFKQQSKQCEEVAGPHVFSYDLIWTAILKNMGTPALDKGCALAESHALGRAASL